MQQAQLPGSLISSLGQQRSRGSSARGRGSRARGRGSRARDTVNCNQISKMNLTSLLTWVGFLLWYKGMGSCLCSARMQVPSPAQQTGFKDPMWSQLQLQSDPWPRYCDATGRPKKEKKEDILTFDITIPLGQILPWKEKNPVWARPWRRMFPQELRVEAKAP